MPPPDADQHQLLNAQIAERLSNVTVFIVGAIVVSLVTVIVVAVVAVIRPQSTALTLIIGITTPVTMALLAAGLQGIHKGINGRLSQLLSQTADAGRAHGRADAIRQLYFQLDKLTPGSPEYEALAAQLRKESLSYFEVVEKRAS
jgi:hypothetical protein